VGIREFTNYLLVFFVLVMEVTVFFDTIDLPIPRGLSLLTFVVLAAVFLKRNQTLHKRFIYVLVITIILIIIQGVLFGFSIVTTITYPLFVFAVPYFLYKIIGKDIFIYVVNVIFYTALFASFIWLIQAIFPPVDNILQALRSSAGNPLINGSEDRYRVSIGMLYTIPNWTSNFFGIEILRNAGIYHEPGAFAYFLILAIGLNTIIEKEFFNRKNLLLSCMLLSTFSTAGYLAFFVLLTYAVFQSELNATLKVFIVPVFFFVAFISFTQLDFMTDKIVEQYETQLDDESVFESRGGRVRRARSAVYLLSSSPFIGRGIISASADFELGSPYFFTGAGIWRTLSSYGMLFAPLIFLIYFLGIRKLSGQYQFDKNIAIYLFIAIAIGATSQRFFMDNITILLFMHGLLHVNNGIDNLRNHGLPKPKPKKTDESDRPDV